MTNNRIVIKRVYDTPMPDDGYRVLIDRLWPRGMKKEAAAICKWMKDVAPSPELRRDFCHDPEKFDTFQVMYEKELTDDEVHRKAVAEILQLSTQQKVTLVYGARDPVHNHAVVLLGHLHNAVLS